MQVSGLKDAEIKPMRILLKYPPSRFQAYSEALCLTFCPGSMQLVQEGSIRRL